MRKIALFDFLQDPALGGPSGSNCALQAVQHAIDLEADIQPVSDFRANASTMLEQVRTTKRPLILTRRGRSAAVLLDIGAYQDLMDELDTSPTSVIESWPSSTPHEPPSRVVDARERDSSSLDVTRTPAPPPGRCPVVIP